MNNQARVCELKCKYNVQGICHIYGECIAKDLFISKLEKIKEEIKGLIDFEESCCDNTILGYECLDVIDKHISELKGDKE